MSDLTKAWASDTGVISGTFYWYIDTETEAAPLDLPVRLIADIFTHYLEGVRHNHKGAGV